MNINLPFWGSKRPHVSPVHTASSSPEPAPNTDQQAPNTVPTSTTEPVTTANAEEGMSIGEPTLLSSSVVSSKPPTAPPAPGAPIAVERTAHSLTIAWAENASDPPPDYDFVLEPIDPKVEYEVRYARAGYKYDMWNSVGMVTTQRWIRILGLLPDQGYVFQVRSRFRNDSNNPAAPVSESVDIRETKKIPSSSHKWSTASKTSKTYATLLEDEQERFDNLGRLRQFIIDGAEGLPPYPEDPEIIDTYGAKAARTMEGLVTAVSKSGLGGAYFALVQNAWKIHKTGLASLIFHPDLQQTVYVLLNFLNIVAGDIGLSSKDVVVGSYFALWEAKRERLLHPVAEYEEHEENRPGVILSQAPFVLINELMFYFPLAGMAYRKSPAQIQWVLDKFTAADPKNTDEAEDFEEVDEDGFEYRKQTDGSKQRGFRLISARTRSAKFKPAFFLAAHEELHTAIFVIRGTHELEDLVTDGLCEVQEASFKFGEDAREFHVHAGMLQAAKWLVRGDDRRRHFEEDERTKSTKEGEDSDDENREGAGVGAAVAKLWAAGYRRVVFCGHSLGGGVAVLAALLIADRFRDLRIQVYGYGTPAVVDETLAEACKGAHSNQVLIQGLGDRVTVKNIVRHDDLVPRLSLLTARDFAKHLKETRSKWGPLLNEDITSFTSRIKTVWAPVQRAHSRKRSVGRLKTQKTSSEPEQSATKRPPSTSEGGAVPMVVEETEESSVDIGSNGHRTTVGEVAQIVANEALDDRHRQAVDASSTTTNIMIQSTDAKGEQIAATAMQIRPDQGEKMIGMSTAEVGGATGATAAATTTTAGTDVEAKKEESKKAQKEVADRLKRALDHPLVVPGLIVHTYMHHGTHMASLVDYKFPPLRRISAFENCIDDHRFEEIMIAVRSVIFATAAREAGRMPPHWESLNDHCDDEEEWQVRCRVCTYPVSWHHTSNSEAFEIRATHHCHSCGKIVCSKCSEGRVALPHIGIITPVRVCDMCKYHLFEPKTGQKHMFDFDEF